MAERREPGDVSRVGLIPVGDEVVESGLDVHGLPEHDLVDHEAEGALLVLLSGLIVLAQLATGAVEHVPGQAVTALGIGANGWVHPSGERLDSHWVYFNEPTPKSA